jgi:hypothetical protein
VADIDNDAERRTRAAGGGLGGERRAVFAARRERAGAKDRDGDQGNRRDEAQPAHDTSMTRAPPKAARIRLSYGAIARFAGLVYAPLARTLVRAALMS